MAKFIGLVGTGSGKAGNFVFSKGDNGDTIVRAYQPKVSNPRTELQVLQRAKMNVVGQFSALCPAALLAPLGKGTKRKNRSYFASKLLVSTTAQFDGEIATASFDPEDVIFSKGSQAILSTAAAPVVTQDAVKVTVTPNIPQDMLGRYGERFVVAILDQTGNSLYDNVLFVDHLFSTNQEDTITVDITGIPLEEGQTVVVWRMSYRLAPVAAGLYGDGIHIATNAITATIGSNSTAVTIDEWGNTVHLATVPFSV